MNPLDASTTPIQHTGFTIVEVMVALALGSVLALAIIQVMVSHTVAERVNHALTSVQENGRFGMLRLQQVLLLTGRYDPLDPALNTHVDIAEEGWFVHKHPVLLPNDVPLRPTLGSRNGITGANDTLVVVGQNRIDCRGYRLGYSAEEAFPVVNEFFVEHETLKCRGFDLRVLRGQKAAVGHNHHAAFSLLDGVKSFQVLYGIDSTLSGRVTQYVPASALTTTDIILTIRIGMLLQSDDAINVQNTQAFAVLDEVAITPATTHVYRQFEHTVSLRNVKYYMMQRP